MNYVEILFENKSDNGNIIYLDNINIHEVFGVGINENVTEAISIYPNPFTNTVSIKTSAKIINDIEIYNSIGKLVYQKEAPTKSTTIKLNLHHLTNGFYLIKINSEKGVITKNIVKY